MIIDIHTHDGVWERDIPHDGVWDETFEGFAFLGETIEEFVADLDRDGVSHCFMSSVTALTKDMVTGNTETFTDSEADPRLFAYVYYDPTRMEESLHEIEKYRNNPKFIGFKTRPEFHETTIENPKYQSLLDAAADLGRPILLHAITLKESTAIQAVAGECDAHFIMAHSGGKDYKQAVTMIRQFDNVSVDPCTSVHYPGKIREILNIIGHERVMFGSDYGLLTRKRILNYYYEAKLSSAEEEAIFRSNASRIFGLKVD